MNVYKPRYRNRQGELKQAARWYAEVTDPQGVRRRVPGFRDKRATEELSRTLHRLAEARASGAPVDPEVRRRLDALPSRIVKRLSGIGLLDSAQVAGSQVLAEHVERWRADLALRDTAAHAAQQAARVLRIIQAANWRFWQDVNPEDLERILAEWRGPDMSIATSNAYRQAAKQFTRHMERTGRASSDPLRNLSRQNAAPDRRRERRALTDPEGRRLLQAAITSTASSGGLTGPERALLYGLALTTGLRLRELHTLTLADLALDDAMPSVTVQARHSKSRRQDRLPLRPDVAATLGRYCAGRPATDRVFPMHAWPRGAAMLRVDLAAAGIPYRDQAGHVADFHSLRHTFITMLARGNVHPKLAQTLARHSTISLTLDVYTHVEMADQAAALQSLPDLAEPNTLPAST